VERKVSPNTARWQQQINQSFEALVNDAVVSPCSVDTHRQADCSDWRYAVEDLRGVCLSIDDIQRKDWSLRHLEQRSDSRDSGLESDAAADRHHVGPVKKPSGTHCTVHHSQHDAVPNEQQLLDPVNRFHSPSQNHQLYDVYNSKKLHSVLKMRQHELTNVIAGYSSHRATIPRHQLSVSPLCDVSQLRGSKSKYLTR